MSMETEDRSMLPKGESFYGYASRHKMDPQAPETLTSFNRAIDGFRLGLLQTVQAEVSPRATMDDLHSGEVRAVVLNPVVPEIDPATPLPIESPEGSVIGVAHANLK